MYLIKPNMARKPPKNHPWRRPAPTSAQVRAAEDRRKAILPTYQRIVNA